MQIKPGETKGLHIDVPKGYQLVKVLVGTRIETSPYHYRQTFIVIGKDNQGRYLEGEMDIEYNAPKDFLSRVKRFVYGCIGKEWGPHLTIGDIKTNG